MGMYRVEWPCCDSATETECWEPLKCPFCEPDEDPAKTELVDALKRLLASDELIQSSSDQELRDAVENGYAPEIREQAAAVLQARAAIAKAEGKGAQ